MVMDISKNGGLFQLKNSAGKGFYNIGTCKAKKNIKFDLLHCFIQ